MRNIALFFALAAFTLTASAQPNREIFEFEYQDVTLNGVLNTPEGTPKGIVMIVHGSGRTNAVAQELHGDIRQTLVQTGYATYMWDKMGCGKSGGTFDYNQTVQSSADEVIAAIAALQQAEIPGSETIGLWGISRAGWINPLVISQYKQIAFWISVSGVDEKENFGYLLEQNLRIEGLPEDSINLIVEEWREGNRICHAGGSFEACVQATQNLSKARFMQRFSPNPPTEEGYYAYQKGFMQEGFETETGLQVYIPDFEETLAQVNCPVLALFGEKDMNVDWTQTRALYERTLTASTSLTVTTFPTANHNLFICKTGGFYEFQDHGLPWNRPEGYLKTMYDWLRNL